MDKTRDVKRGVSRFSRHIKQQQQQQQQQQQHKLFSGLDNKNSIVSLKKPKKERVKRLSSVVNNKASSSNEECEMGCDLASDREEEPKLQSEAQSTSNGASGKKFRLPKKFFDDCNSVDHASVPRKLRSAMKKRNCESMSPPPLPDSKRLNRATARVELPKKNGFKKPKLYMKDGGFDASPKQTVSGSITKDEEEVAETLFVLAGMFLENEKNSKSKLDSQSLEANPPDLPEVKDSPMTAVEDSAVTKEELNTVCPASTADATPPPDVEKSLKGTVEVDPMKESVTEQPDLPDSKKFHVESATTSPLVNLQCIRPSSTKREQADEKLIPKLKMDIGLKHPTRPETSLLERNPEIVLGARATESQLSQRRAINESWKDSLALWPGLSSTGSYHAGILNPPAQTTAAKIPPWLDAAVCASKPCSLGTGISNGKDSTFNVDRKSLKRCAAHIYICRLIRIFQGPASKDTLPLLPTQVRQSEGSKQGVITMVNDFNKLRNGLLGVAYSTGIGRSTAERNLNEDRNGILLHNRLQQDQPQAAPTTGVHALQKQSFDFLSLSAGGGGVETSRNGYARTGNGLEPLSRFQFPYLESLVQHQTFVPLSVPQTRYNSPAYSDQISAAAAQQVQPQLPHRGGSLSGIHTSSSTLNKQQQQQQQHHQFWAAQMAAQYQPTGTSTSISQFPNWHHNGRQDSSSSVPCSQAIIPSSLELLCPKYSPIPQQHQQLTAITSSLPASRVKRNDHHLLSGCEETGVGFRGGGALPLHLLCNERLQS